MEICHQCRAQNTCPVKWELAVICEAITSHLLLRDITIPTEEVQVQEIMDASEKKTVFSHVIGARDDCHKPIICPKDYPVDYHNRKGFLKSSFYKDLWIVACVSGISFFFGQDVSMTRVF